jgi:RNA polymerase sigma-54 factor
LDQFGRISTLIHGASQRLQIRQSQALVMTPQLMQAIKLLQLSNLDLVAYVEAELERNPLLDRPARKTERPAAADGAQIADRPAGTATGWNGGEPRRAANPAKSGSTPARGRFPDDAEAEPPRGRRRPRQLFGMGGVGSGGRDDGDYNLEAFVPPRPRSPTGCASS